MRRKLKFLSPIVLTILTLAAAQLALVGVANAQPLPIGMTAQNNPFESNPMMDTPSGVSVIYGYRAYDGDLTSAAMFKYTVDGYWELSMFTDPTFWGKTQFTISFVEFKVRYKAFGATDDGYRIVYYVGAAGPVVLQDWVYGADAAADLGTRAWHNQPEPNDGVWDWTDIMDVRVVFETDMVDTSDGSKYLYVYEVWLTIYSTPPPQPVSMSVQPSVVSGIPVGEFIFVDIYIAGVEGQLGFEFILSFDPAVLEAWPEFYVYYPYTAALPSEIGPGYVAIAYLTKWGDPVGFTGTTPAARIYFTVIAEGTTVLDLHDTLLTNVQGETIPHEVIDGVFYSEAFPEFPMGMIAPLALIPVLAYAWWTRKSKNNTHAYMPTHARRLCRKERA